MKRRPALTQRRTRRVCTANNSGAANGMENDMGQYHNVVNIDRLEFLEPRAFGDGPKLTEFAFSAGGMLSALSGLLATSSGRGFGDFHTSSNPSRGLNGQDEWLAECGYTAELVDEFVLGRWAGNRIAIIGDYFQADDLADWGSIPRPFDEPPKILAAGASFGNDCGLWTDVSRLGIALIGLEEPCRDAARAMLLPDAGGECVASVSDFTLRRAGRSAEQPASL